MRPPTDLLSALRLSQTSLKANELRTPSLQQSEGGFTLIELIATVLMIGVLAAIAAPSWLGFVQQRRVNSVREEVFEILQNARVDAKRTKRSRTVEFDSGSFQYTLSGNGLLGPITQDLGGRLGIEPGQVDLRTDNIIGTANSVTFNYLGEVDQVDQVGFTVIATAADSTGDATQRCVTVTTLLGALSQASGSDCTILPPE